MLLDELMGWARAAAGMPAMTISLDVNHHRPVPVLTPLRVVARVARTDGREIFVDGSITTETDPPTTAVTASGVFVKPDPDRAGTLFPSLREGS
ncbi:PaaI family thioesterase [Streptomyces sp. NPDC001406]|uniref:PaaI family thioesterase n=1 Tax=Streptomyces sp. NPDC001406 TaxID=3364572 RepID=UPI0036822CE4